MKGGSVMGNRKHLTQKQKLSILESANEIGIEKAADLAGIHYTTVYDWQKKLDVLGERTFLSYRPPSRGRGIKKITAEQENAVLDTWGRYPGFGPSQIHNQLRRQGVTISTRTVQKIMSANGYQVKAKKQKEKESERFEANRPLELVQMDIMEFFIHKLKVYLLLLLDDFSRFILGFRLLSETSIDAVIGLMQEVIYRYGKMEEILSDRGFVFYSWRGANRFERYLEVEGIHNTHSRPHHPQTLGKIEAVNKHLQKELIKREEFKSVSEAEVAIEKWIKTYNYERTHQGLGGFLVPAERFHGRVDEVLKFICEGLDPTAKTCYVMEGISRSLVNLVIESEGRMTLYFLGQPLKLFGGTHETESR
jgi:transposase InsO family protein